MQISRSEHVSDLKELIEKFDATFYKTEYEIDLESPGELLLHFVSLGAHQGLSPNKFFDISKYLATHRDVLASGMNGFEHYLRHGRFEGRSTCATVRTKFRLTLYDRKLATKWRSMVDTVIDRVFYRCQLLELQPHLKNHDIDLSLHYLLLGWRLGLSPNKNKSFAKLTNENSELAALDLCPLYLAHLSHLVKPRSLLKPVRRENLLSKINPDNKFNDEMKASFLSENNLKTRSSNQKNKLEIIQSDLFDAEFYLKTYSDIQESRDDPLDHYISNGWIEGRDPSALFSTSFYCSTYGKHIPSGEDPLSHYIKSGKSKGYLRQDPRNWRLSVLARVNAPANIQRGIISYRENELLLGKLSSLLRKKKVVLSVSHDCYLKHTGGIQAFISDEASTAFDFGYCHLHVAPCKPGLLVGEDLKTQRYIVSLDKKVIGTIDGKILLENLKENAETIIISIHSFLGISKSIISQLSRLAKYSKCFVWLHDYSLICNGYNLLRNNIDFCGAPPSDSTACSVCVYSEGRNGLQELIENFKRNARPQLLAPSRSAADVYLSSVTDADKEKIEVLPHLALSKKKKRITNKAGIIKIAYVGFESDHKGWPILKAVAPAITADKRLALYHFSAGGRTSLENVIAVNCAVSLKKRNHTVELLKKYQIDAVIIPSLWPETFSYVTAEALIAGCLVICFRSSGNVYGLSSNLNQTLVFDNDTDLIDASMNQTLYGRICVAARSAYFHSSKTNRGIFEILSK